MSHPCPRCGVPAPVVVSSDGALPPELVMADEAARLREALEQVVKACRNCGGSGIAVRRYNFPDLACGAEGCKIARAALATATTKGG